MSTNPSGISQSNSGQMFGGMQAAFGDRNQQNIQAPEKSDVRRLSQEDAVGLLYEIKKIVIDSVLPNETKDKITSRLSSAIDDIQQKEPNKQLAAGNLKRMAETLEDASKTLDSGKNVWKNVKPILELLPGWLSVAKSFFF